MNVYMRLKGDNVSFLFSIYTSDSEAVRMVSVLNCLSIGKWEFFIK